MDEALTHEEKQLIMRGARVVSFMLIAFLLSRNVTQVDLPSWQLSICLGLMSGFNSMFGIVRLILCLLALEVLFPVSLFIELIRHMN